MFQGMVTSWVLAGAERIPLYNVGSSLLTLTRVMFQLKQGWD